MCGDNTSREHKYLLLKFDVSSPSITGDIFLNWLFCFFEQFKGDGEFAVFRQVDYDVSLVTLGRSTMMVILLT